MTDQEQLIALRMEILKLEDEVLTLGSALRKALNFAQETAINAARMGSGGTSGSLANFLEETSTRGLRLNETYRQLLDIASR